MNCKEFQGRTSEFIDHLLDDAERQRYMNHLAGCPSCRAHLSETRGVVELFRAVPATAPPADLLDSTLRAIDRMEEPRLTILTAPHRENLRLRDRHLVALARRFFVDYEFKLIAYSTGLVVSFFLFTGVLAGLRPLAELGAIIAEQRGNKPPVIWITARESEAMGERMMAYTVPRLKADNTLPPSVPETGELMIIAEVQPDGRAVVLEVLNGPSDPAVVDRLQTALNHPSFVPAKSAGTRQPVRGRVVLLFQSVDVIG